MSGEGFNSDMLRLPRLCCCCRYATALIRPPRWIVHRIRCNAQFGVKVVGQTSIRKPRRNNVIIAARGGILVSSYKAGARSVFAQNGIQAARLGVIAKEVSHRESRRHDKEQSADRG